MTNLLAQLGLSEQLDLKVDASVFNSELEAISSDWWKAYNPRKPDNPRFGLSLTSLDGEMTGRPDLDSLLEHSKETGTLYSETDFKTPTPALERLECLHPIFDAFNYDVGRCHLLRFQRGGHFPPHRDAYGSSFDTFRLLVPLRNASSKAYHLVVSDQALKLNQWCCYYLNTVREHSLFSFQHDVIFLVMNIPATKTHLKNLFKHFLVK